MDDGFRVHLLQPITTLTTRFHFKRRHSVFRTL